MEQTACDVILQLELYEGLHRVTSFNGAYAMSSALGAVWKARYSDIGSITFEETRWGLNFDFVVSGGTFSEGLILQSNHLKS